MPDPEVLVVGETPSLGRSITEWLLAEKLRARCVYDLEEAAPLDSLGSRHPVVIAASNGPCCPTGRRWVEGKMPLVSLIVVGSRDPKLDEDARLHRVDLPLSPGRLLDLVRSVLADSQSTGRSLTADIEVGGRAGRRRRSSGD